MDPALIDALKPVLASVGGFGLIFFALKWMRDYQVDIGNRYANRVHEQDKELTSLRAELSSARGDLFACDLREAALRRLLTVHGIEIPPYLQKQQG